MKLNKITALAAVPALALGPSLAACSGRRQLQQQPERHEHQRLSIQQWQACMQNAIANGTDPTLCTPPPN